MLYDVLGEDLYPGCVVFYSAGSSSLLKLGFVYDIKLRSENWYEVSMLCKTSKCRKDDSGSWKNIDAVARYKMLVTSEQAEEKFVLIKDPFSYISNKKFGSILESIEMAKDLGWISQGYCIGKLLSHAEEAKGVL